MPNQSDPNQQSAANPPAVAPPMDLPPLPQDFPSGNQSPATGSPPPADQGSAAPPETPPVISTPKKKFGGGRIIATILGVLVLVGGVGAGYILTQQPQLFQQQAKTCADYGSAAKRNACLNGSNGPVDCPAGMVSCGASNNRCTSYSECVTIGQQQNNKKTNEGGTCSGCIQPGQACTDTIECTDGYGCHSGICSSTGVGGSACLSDGTCAGGYSCNTSTNRCEALGVQGAACSSDTNCANGYTCTGGSCQGNPVTATCGRNIDTGAPVCCTGACTGTVVCEPGVGGSGRQECDSGGVHCTIKAKSSSCTGANTTTTESTPGPSAPPGAPQCLNVTAYSSTWTLLTSTDLSALTSGSVVNFCVAGSAGTFDQAQFKINTTTEPITTTKGQGAAASDFCQSYTILSTDTTVSVKAKIHDATSSTWVGESF